MTLISDIKNACSAAKRVVLENMEIATEKTGKMNPYGDETLLLDKRAEDNAVQVLHDSSTVYSILTEERGLIIPKMQPEYLAIIDPIDGSTNLERGIPLCCIGMSIIPFKEYMTTENIELSVIDSFFTDECYVAQTGKGATKNGNTIHPSTGVAVKDAIISYDTKKSWKGKFGQQSLRTIEEIYDVRRSGANLLDLCWTASGALEAMADLRDILPIVHVSGTHMVVEAGGYVLDQNGNRMCYPIELDQRMSFVAAANEEIARKIIDNFSKTHGS
ncbi:MAG: inositol monophosphatase family protein [Candidatus Thorarchaeota archaeon]